MKAAIMAPTTPTLSLAIAILVLAVRPCPGQMEKRDAELYGIAAFQKAEPTVGKEAPDIVLKTIDGNSVRLSDFPNQIVVLIKGGYT